MHTKCPMANGSKITNLTITTAAIIVVSSILVLADAQNNVQPEEIFILAGQSNMAGRGALQWNNSLGMNQFYPERVPVEDQPDPEKIFRLNAQLGWEVAKDPLHFDIDRKPAGVGPGMSFANAIKGQVGIIGLVPCAVGETSIEMWQRGGELYNNMLKRSKAAVQGGGKIKALLWYQGEYDSSHMDTVTSYKVKVEMFFQNVREDLSLPTLPIIQVALASWDEAPNLALMESLRTIQKSINLPNLITVDAKGLAHYGMPDAVHLTSQGQVKLGPMLAKAYLDNFLKPASS